MLVLGLLILVTGGVVYLTAAEWRDRRRRQEEKLLDKRTKSRPSGIKNK